MVKKITREDACSVLEVEVGVRAAAPSPCNDWPCASPVWAAAASTAIPVLTYVCSRPLPLPALAAAHPPPTRRPPARPQEDAEYDVIRKAYKRLSLQWHPDKLPPEREQEGREMFQKINAAYQVGGVAGGGGAMALTQSEWSQVESAVLPDDACLSLALSAMMSQPPPLVCHHCRRRPPPAARRPQKLVNDEGDSEEDEDEDGFDGSSSFERMYEFFQYM